MPTLNKAEIRRTIQEKRKQLTASLIKEASQQAAKRLLETDLYKKSQKIAAYYAVNGELDPDPFLSMAAKSNKSVFLPVITKHKQLMFAPYTQNTVFKPNQYHIPEPVTSESELLDATQLHLICVPVVAFDTQGNRLGMGGGYYDRTLAILKPSMLTQCIGMAYEFQKFDYLAPDSWDIAMNYIITERTLYRP